MIFNPIYIESYNQPTISLDNYMLEMMLYKNELERQRLIEEEVARMQEYKKKQEEAIRIQRFIEQVNRAKEVRRQEEELARYLHRQEEMARYRQHQKELALHRQQQEEIACKRQRQEEELKAYHARKAHQLRYQKEEEDRKRQLKSLFWDQPSFACFTSSPVDHSENLLTPFWASLFDRLTEDEEDDLMEDQSSSEAEDGDYSMLESLTASGQKNNTMEHISAEEKDNGVMNAAEEATTENTNEETPNTEEVVAVEGPAEEADTVNTTEEVADINTTEEVADINTTEEVADVHPTEEATVIDPSKDMAIVKDSTEYTPMDTDVTVDEMTEEKNNNELNISADVGPILEVIMEEVTLEEDKQEDPYLGDTEAPTFSDDSSVDITDTESSSNLDPTITAKLDTLSIIRNELEQINQSCENDLLQSALDFSTVINSDDSLPHMIPATSANNRKFLDYEDRIMKLLMKVDTVESNGNIIIRRKRKSIVKLAEKMLDTLDNFKQKEWERSSSIHSDEEVV